MRLVARSNPTRVPERGIRPAKPALVRPPLARLHLFLPLKTASQRAPIRSRSCIPSRTTTVDRPGGSSWRRRRSRRPSRLGLGSVGCGHIDEGSTARARNFGGQRDPTPPATRSMNQATWAISSEPGSLDWILDYDPDSNTVLANVTESLLQMSPALPRSNPALAESYTQPDPLTWDFHIPPGCQFHDGSELTADDVVYSLTAESAARRLTGTCIRLRSLTSGAHPPIPSPCG